MSTDSEVKTPTPPTKPELVPTPQQERSERVRQADINAIGSRDNAKNFATNQGVFGHVKKEVGRSELAISQAMTEVFRQFNEQITETNETVANLNAALEALRDAFEKVSKAQQAQHGTAFARLSALEYRIWERLMRDLEWDLYGIRDWFMGLFGWVAGDIEVHVDPDVVDITPYLMRNTEEDEETAATENPEGAQLEFPDRDIQPTDDAVFSDAEWTVCCCGHIAEQHSFSDPAPCTVEGCGCSNFVAVGSTMDPSVVVLE